VCAGTTEGGSDCVSRYHPFASAPTGIA
jgi:hypothetical protein